MSQEKTNSSPPILYESPDKSIVVLDIPRTLELAQIPPHGDPPPDRRIISAQPVTEPYATPEPKKRISSGAQNKSPASHVADLMAAATVESALEHVSESYAGLFLLPRVVDADPVVTAQEKTPYIPEGARYIQGSLDKTRQKLAEEAPPFDLIVLDPPWPNRSARRKTDSYSTVYSLFDMDRLLDNVPVLTHLKANGLVAIWITNKSSVLDSVTSSSSGLFVHWGLETVAEWTWLKVTDSGEPIYDIHSEWRKPWEKLLIAKRIGAPTPTALTSKTLLAVPDLHSRKPNLKGLFGGILGPEHVGLEVFARNLTASWWAWGDEALRFQAPECWSESQ